MSLTGVSSSIETLLAVAKLMRQMCILQEELETARVEGAEAASARDALQSQLSQAVATEDSLKTKCHNMEVQAACTAGQLQEMQQQVRKSAPMAPLSWHSVFWCPLHLRSTETSPGAA